MSRFGLFETSKVFRRPCCFPVEVTTGSSPVSSSILGRGSSCSPDDCPKFLEPTVDLPECLDLSSDGFSFRGEWFCTCCNIVLNHSSIAAIAWSHSSFCSRNASISSSLSESFVLFVSTSCFATLSPYALALEFEVRPEHCNASSFWANWSFSFWSSFSLDRSCALCVCQLMLLLLPLQIFPLLSHSCGQLRWCYHRCVKTIRVISLFFRYVSLQYNNVSYTATCSLSRHAFVECFMFLLTYFLHLDIVHKPLVFISMAFTFSLYSKLSTSSQFILHKFLKSCWPFIYSKPFVMTSKLRSLRTKKIMVGSTLDLEASYSIIQAHGRSTGVTLVIGSCWYMRMDVYVSTHCQ